ncbi:probable cation-transporting ATPase 13A3 [Mizuhopecten yessoensis]|uniref:Cation-transporting ATPase n=1 Tax=Mizuhopecten yessoensis TaxID=6573 RepID=A0A210QA34_MIZYE|nr:probable cation-transporting ATPase 13A3 [Mizuhopecten yessoensis]OWF45588.1 cation-transporting ATPase 13A3 [Mizuhopecten yessoensis]
MGTSENTTAAGPGKTNLPDMKGDVDYVNHGMEDQMEIQGYIRSKMKTAVVIFFSVITGGLLRLFLFWFPYLLVMWTHRKCQIDVAIIVILKDQFNQRHVSEVMTAMVDKGYSAITGSSLRSSFKRSVSNNFSKRRTSDTTPLLNSDDKLEFDVVRYFISKKVKYVWNPEKDLFEKLRGLEQSTSCSYFHNTKGQSRAEQIKSRATYGVNRIDVNITPLFQLFFLQVLSPFYVFQMFSATVWFIEWYYYYAGFIVGISILSMSVAIYQTRTTELALRSTIESSSNVLVCRGKNVYEEISSDDLVPGDVIEIPRRGCMMQCDAVLVSGNCIVNEGMLTGESVPITKTPLPNPSMSRSQEDVMFSMREHARHVLFCGTKVIQTRYYDNHKVQAVVIRTGYNTAKGELVRSIMFPKPIDFKFEVDTYKFLAFLACLAAFGCVYTFWVMAGRDLPADEVILMALDLVTVAVPAALPAALTIGIVFAQYRLKKWGIFCISPKRITVSGTLNVVCFDKTGTITEDGLDMKSVIPVTEAKFHGEVTSLSTMTRSPIMAAMTTCHSLTIIDDELCGDPIDLIMFGATNWELVEPGQEESRFDQMAPTIVRPVATVNNIYNDSFDSNFQLPVDEIGIIRQFTFSSSLQRMSVITRKLGDKNFELYTKGAPEKVISLCKSDTVPVDFHEVLTQYTQRGLRVLALAWRPLPGKLKYTKIQRIQREQVEKDLRFLGLMVMENRLKPSSASVIHQLKDANIRPIMVTGDNMLTALSVARECGMIDPMDNIILVQAYPAQGWSEASLEYIYTDSKAPEDLDLITLSGGRIGNTEISEKFNEVNSKYHLATDGRSWAVIRQYFPDMIPKLVVKGTVFARMSPEQKSQLVEELQELEYYVGMCGDGANDCGALKTAHAGISLSEAEASVASPFTSKNPDIECVPTLIREGRAALTTSFGIFKYMCMYSLVMFTTICILYWKNANLTDFQFLFIDLILLTTLSISFSWTGAYSKLVPDPPLLKLVSISPILSVFSQTVISMGFQVFVYSNISEQVWFIPFVENDEWDYRCHEVTALFMVSNFQYFFLSIAFSKGAPYRKSVFSNYPFMVNLVFCFAMNAWLTLHPGQDTEEFIELQPPPFLYRLVLLGIAFINGMVSILFEMLVIDSKYISRTLQTRIEEMFKGASYKYLEVEKDIEKDISWPPTQTKPSNLVDAFARMDSAHNVPDFDQNSLLSSLLYSSSGSYKSHSLHSTGSLRFSSGSYKVGMDEEQLIGSLGKEQDATSMGAIFPYLTKMEDITVKQYGNVEGFVNELPPETYTSRNRQSDDPDFANEQGDNIAAKTLPPEYYLGDSNTKTERVSSPVTLTTDQHVVPEIKIIKPEQKSFDFEKDKTNVIYTKQTTSRIDQHSTGLKDSNQSDLHSSETDAKPDTQNDDIDARPGTEDNQSNKLNTETESNVHETRSIPDDDPTGGSSASDGDADNEADKENTHL